MTEKAIPIGVCILLMDINGYVLVGERLVSRGKGKLAFPGGHLERDDESLIACAARELREETGLGLDPNETPVLHAAYHHMGDDRWVTIYVGMLCALRPVNIKNLEPDKTGPWQWVQGTRLAQSPNLFGGDDSAKAMAALNLYRELHL